MKISKYLSALLVSAIIIGILPAQAISANVQVVINRFEANQMASEMAETTVDTMFSGEDTLHAELTVGESDEPDVWTAPPTFSFDNSALEEYVYVSKAEREAVIGEPTPVSAQTVRGASHTDDTHPPMFSDFLSAMTPEDASRWERYVAILGAATYYSELSMADKTFFCEYAMAASGDLAALEAAGLTLIESLPYAKAALKYEISAATLLESFPDSAELSNFSTQMVYYRCFLDDNLIGSEVDALLRGYLLKGHSTTEVLSAYGVSRALDIGMDSLLSSVPSKLPGHLSSTDRQNYVLLADDLGVQADKLAKYAVDHALPFQALEKLTDKASAYIAELSAMQQPIMGIAASGGTEDTITPSSDNVGAPYSYDYNNTEKVSLNSGALIYETVDYSLPGVNGLDLTIGRRYDSDAANVYAPIGSPAQDRTIYYVWWATETWYEVPGIGDDVSYSMTSNVGAYSTYLSAKSAYDSKPSGSSRKIAGSNAYGNIYFVTCYSKGRWEDDQNSSPAYSYTQANTFLNSHYGLGTGWSFMFASIQNGKYLRLADGRSFEILITTTAGDSNLKDYTLTDLRLEKESGGYSNGSVSSEYTLHYKDGRKEYFSSDGKLIGIRDRYNNTIKFVHDTLNAQPRITITDTLNRITTISSSGVVSGKRTVTVALPNSITLKYTVSTMTSPVTCSALTAYTNPVNVTTDFSYTVSAAGFDVWNKGTTGATNYYMNLTSIKHPTGAFSDFTYSPVQRNLGSNGLQTYFRITSRLNRINAAVYDEKVYSYSPNNSSGWPAQYNPLNLPTGFTYSTTVKTVLTGLEETHAFDNKHLTTSITSKVGTKKIQDKLFDEYNADKLPVKVTTRTYDYTNNSISAQSIELAEYDSKGNITASWTPLANGNKANTDHKTTYGYDLTYSQLKSVSYKQNANTTITQTYTLDSNNRHPLVALITVGGVQKAKTEWGYDSFGNVTFEKRYRDGLSTFYLTEYTYQNNAYLSSIKTNGVLTADGTNVTASPGYSTGVIATKYEYDTLGRLIKMTDPRGNVTSYAYNPNGELTKVTNLDNTTRQYTRNYTANNVVYTNEKGTQLKTTYTALGLEYEIIDVLTNTVLRRKAYDALGRPATETDLINNSVTTYAYDHLSRITARTVKRSSTTLAQETYAYAVTSDGLFKTTKTQVGDSAAPSIITTSYVNNVGFEVKTGKIFNSIEYFDTSSYDYAGNRTQLLTALDSSKGRSFTAKWEYDHAGQVTRATNTLNQSATWTYDALGRNVTATDYAGSISSFTYDALDRLLKQETPFEKVGSTVYKAVKKYDYDQSGNVIRGQTQNNVSGAAASWSKVEYAYNNRGFLSAVRQYDGPSVASKADYTYDATGNVLTQTTGTGTDNYATTTYTYDRFENLLSQKDPLGQSEYYTYDLAGNIKTKTDRNGITTTYTYDGLGRPLTTNAVKDSANIGTVAVSYTLTGQVKTMSNDGVTVTNTYDALGRLVKESETVNVVKDYTYDIGGNRTGFKLTNNGTIILNTTYEYDELWRLKAVKENGVEQASYTYDVNGNRKTLTEANGVVASYEYNLANMVTGLQNKKGAAVQSSFAYTYYLDGNQKGKSDDAGRTTGYIYDGLGRLTKESESGAADAKTFTYTYDAQGNRKTLTVSGAEAYSVVYSYDLNNRLLTAIKTVETLFETTTYRYDPNGNTVSSLVETVRPGGETAKIYFGGNGYEISSYNGLNQLVSTVKDGVETTYTYRPDGLRRSKTTDGVKTTHIWDGQNVVAELSGSNVSAKYLRGVNLISSTVSGSVRYFSFNAHGDVVQLTNASGVVTKTYRYDAFGVESNRDDADTNPWRYCGEYWDGETETVYLRARYYSPGMGRFTSEDPHWNTGNMIYGDNPVKWNEREPDEKDPLELNTYTYKPDVTAIMQSGNLYTYCMNNPLSYSDPTGKAAINILFAAIGGIAGWFFGDYVATQLGLSGWKYWAVRAGVTVGGAVIGWFAGAAVTKIAAGFLQANPAVIFKLANALGATGFMTAMNFLGINPINLIPNSGTFIGFITSVLNTPSVHVGLDWAKSIIQKAQEYGYSIRLDAGHIGTNWEGIWHLNIGKWHVALSPNIVESIKKILGIN